MIDRGTCKAMLRESARLMLEQADRLSDIDSKFGDGDHGITITKIAKLMDERAEAWDEESIKDFLDDLGMAASWWTLPRGSIFALSAVIMYLC